MPVDFLFQKGKKKNWEGNSPKRTVAGVEGLFRLQRLVAGITPELRLANMQFWVYCMDNSVIFKHDHCVSFLFMHKLGDTILLLY